MNSKSPTVERIRQPTLFDLQEPSGTTDRPITERPFSLPGIFLGTSSFTAAYAAEGGTVVAAVSGNPPSAQGYPACAGQGVPASYVKIKGTDGYYTVYVHVTSSVAVNTQVSQGQQIGVTNNSGCQSAGHIHMRRTDPSGIPVNFTIPCVNKLPTTSFADGLVDDDDPDNL